MPATLLRILYAASPTVSDAELLGRFVSNRDADAFEELLRRHGPAVYRVCRRLVGDSSADDAFQATFLILACHAASVRKAASVGSWLVGVAGRVARQHGRRERRSRLLLESLPARTSEPEPFDDLAAVLDDELTRLPEHLRAPIVLCHMEGRTQEEAAAELGGSLRTLRRRLERAKNVLRLRLERRGVVPAIAAALVAGTGSAMAVPPELLQITVRNVFAFRSGGASTPAAILAKGVVMGSTRYKVGGLIGAAAAVMIGLGIGFAGDPDKDPLIPPPVPGTKKDAPVAAAPAGGERSVYQSVNFRVSAPSAVQARMIATEAEFQRRELAKRWLGKELPDWSERVRISFQHREKGTGGETAFNFRSGTALSAEMKLTGPFLATVEGGLPHEIVHCVLATHFGKPVARWADEGIALQCEPAAEQERQILLGRELLDKGRAIRLKHLFKMTEYPRDMAVLYAEGHSVVRFLLKCKPLDAVILVPGDGEGAKLYPSTGPAAARQRTPRECVMEFVRLGMDGNSVESWNKAAKTVYGFDSVDALEAAWIEWLIKPENDPNVKPSKLPADDKPELIPPPKLPQPLITR